jgi:YfiH family protein
VDAQDVLVPQWLRPAGVRVVVTTRRLPGASRAPFDAFNLGARGGDDPAAVAANRAALVTLLGLPSPPCWLRQVHGTDVFDADACAGAADAPAGADEPVADAAVTRRPRRVLAILTADCLPVVFCADDGSALGVAHAGWRGLAGGVLEATLAALGVPPARTIAWLGPAIGPSSYEVGEELRAAFIATDASAAAAFTPTRPGHWHCDLQALARGRLGAAGVRNVQGGGFDTRTDARFYSYRRDGATGRFATLAWLD